MASSVALRRAAASALFSRASNPLRSAAAAPSVARRSFNTNAQMKSFEDEYGRDADADRRSVSRRREPGLLFSDVFDHPFSQTRSLGQVFNMVDQLMDNPFVVAARPAGGASRRPWEAKEDKDALFLRMDMPGVGKEDVKVSVEQNTLVIKGEGKYGLEGGEESRKFSSRLDLPPELYNLGEIKAEMKNGVLKLTVPKVKEQPKEVFHVNIE